MLTSKAAPKFPFTVNKALAEDGVFDLDNESLESVKSAEDLIDLFKKQIDTHLDETQKRIKSALETGVPVDEVQGYEKTLNILNSIKEEDINAETEDGENLRRQLIYQDYINRGFKPESALILLLVLLIVPWSSLKSKSKSKSSSSAILFNLFYCFGG